MLLIVRGKSIIYTINCCYQRRCCIAFLSDLSNDIKKQFKLAKVCECLGQNFVFEKYNNVNKYVHNNVNKLPKDF